MATRHTTKYLVRLYASLAHLSPTPQNQALVNEKLAAPLGLSVVTATEQLPGVAGAMERIALVAQGNLQVMIGIDSLFLQRVAPPDRTTDAGSFREFLEFAKRMGRLFFTAFEIPISRLAVVHDEGLFELTPEQHQSIPNNLQKTPPTFDSPVLDWGWQRASRAKRPFGSRQDEDMNSIVTAKHVVSIVPATLQSIEYVYVSYDMSTLRENASARFKMDDADAFLDESESWINGLEDEFLRFIGMGS